MILYDAKHGSKNPPFKKVIYILYHDDISIMAYVIDLAFGLGTYIMDRYWCCICDE